MSLSAIRLDPGVHKLHQRVPLHQHVSEGGAGEHPDHLGAQPGKVPEVAGVDPVQHLVIHPGISSLECRDLPGSPGIDQTAGVMVL